MTTIKVADIDIIYLSYDEPNCEANWQHLLGICPRAQRVHGIKGSDAAHKACADVATGTHMITIDGDNQIDPTFLTQSWSFDSTWDLTNSVLSFPSRNAVNGLCYGNGGIKIWPRRVVEQMQTHEAVDLGSAIESASVDFCWVLDYVLMPGVWSQALINHTAHQAWRAGFREGVKLSLVEGQRIRDPAQWRASMVKNNMDRLLIWLQVGLDQANGAWAILGARQGLHRCLLTDWDHTLVQDFDLLDSIWEREIEALGTITDYTQDLGQELRDRLQLALEPDPFTAAQSYWFKSVFGHPARAEPRRLRS